MRALLTLILVAHAALATAEDHVCAPKKEVSDVAVIVSAQEAAKQAIAANDLRFLSSSLCSEMVPGYPVDQIDNKAFPKPWGKDVRPLGESCEKQLGKELYDLLLKNKTYAEEYNKAIAEHLKKALK